MAYFNENYLPHETVQIKEHILEAIKLRISMEISDNVARELQVHQMYDYIAQKTKVMFESAIMAEVRNAKCELEVKTPKNWFEHLKEAHAPKWYLKKYPVKYDVRKSKFDFERKYFFPDVYGQGQQFNKYYVHDTLKKDDRIV